MALDNFNNSVLHFLHCGVLIADAGDGAKPLAQEVLHLSERVAAKRVDFDLLSARFPELLRLALGVRLQGEDHVGLGEIIRYRHRYSQFVYRALQSLAAYGVRIDA